ncbi:MAG: DUF420 domain-containing protein [Deltaproteobacteria bacterium]|nr:DUF420 domain-containing protein [Deltaproteobacteria bacterium]
MTAVTSDRPPGLRAFLVVNAALSAVAFTVLVWILWVRPRAGGTASVDLTFLPAVNAALNASASVLLCTGVVFIRKGRRAAHRACMLAALCCSALFLLGYLAYHYIHGDTKYAGDGVVRTVYLVILASHVILSTVLLPLVLTTLYFALSETFPRHRRLARVTFPTWLYVSVTGVVIFFMLRGSAPSMP